jgi:transmembrane sensor
MNPSDLNDPETMLEEEATRWVLERDDGFAAGRAEAFAEWCRSDPRHALAVTRVERSLALLGELPTVRAPLVARMAGAAASESDAKKFAGNPRSRPWVWASGMAAALALGASAWWMGQTSPAPQIYETSGSEPRRISLNDGSVVDLNANSRVEARFTAGERRLTLGAGEAHFQVAHNAARPFIVTANGISVRAVGTAFDVRLAGETVDVVVSEGKVAVDRQSDTAFFVRKQTPVIPLLVAGERTQVASRGETAPQVEKIAAAQVDSLLSWQNRMTSFVDVPLSEMVARINRCNTLQLVIGDPQLGARKVGGVIDLKQVNAFVRFLEQDGGIVSERAPTGEIILRLAR